MTTIQDSEFRTEVGGIKRKRITHIEDKLVLMGVPVSYVYETEHGWGTIVLANGTGTIAKRPGGTWMDLKHYRNHLICEAARNSDVDVCYTDGQKTSHRVCISEGELVGERFLDEGEILDLVKRNVEESENGIWLYHAKKEAYIIDDDLFADIKRDRMIAGMGMSIGKQSRANDIPDGYKIQWLSRKSNYLADAAYQLRGWLSELKPIDALHILFQLRADHDLIPAKVL